APRLEGREARVLHVPAGRDARRARRQPRSGHVQVQDHGARGGELTRRARGGRARPPRAGATLAAMALVSLATAAVPDGPPPASPLGLDDAADFVVTSGDYSSLAPAPRLYFAKEWIAVPREGVPVSGHATGVSAFDDVRAWSSSLAPGRKPDARPPLVWIGSPERVRGAKLAPDASSM